MLWRHTFKIGLRYYAQYRNILRHSSHFFIKIVYPCICLIYLRSVKVYNFKMFLEIRHYAILFRLAVGAGGGANLHYRNRILLCCCVVFNYSNFAEKWKLVGLTIKQKSSGRTQKSLWGGARCDLTSILEVMVKKLIYFY